MNFAFKCVTVFFVACVVDIAYAYYIRRTAEGKALSASFWSGGIAASGAFNILAYTADRRLILPMIAGYIVGTYWAVRKDHPPS